MDFTGMMLGYKKNRSLTDEERTLQLKQKQRLNIEPNYDLCTIQLNGIFLESVDRYYAWKGVLFTFMTTVLTGLLVGCSVVMYIIANRVGTESSGDKIGDVIFISIFVLAFTPVFVLFVWTALKESFTYTHFPIRLNRKNRKVYVFRPGRPSKPILVADWDKLFFTLGRCNRGAADIAQLWDIRAHVVAADGITVLDTFAFSPFTVRQEDLRSHWEFLRRYMEEGPQEAYSLVKVCLPIANQRESFRIAANRFYLNFKGGLGLWFAFLPLWLLCMVGRWIAGLTCRCPVWPEDIERECQIDPDDPYRKDASMNPPNAWEW